MTDPVKIKRVEIHRGGLNESLSVIVQDDTGIMDDVEERALRIFKDVK